MATAVAGIYDQVKNAVAEYVPVATVTVVRGANLGAKVLVLPDRVEGTLGDDELDRAAVEDARSLLAEERSETRVYPFGDGEVELFHETFPPPPTLLIFGAVHVAQALTRFAKQLGFRVIVTDARAKLATAERFPEADRIIQAWPDDALNELTIEPNTYVAILTHDPKFDEPALLGTLERRRVTSGRSAVARRTPIAVSGCGRRV
jgi:xanthine dehydrogenase accessory factor